MLSRFCTCWEKPPTLKKVYPNSANSDCYYNCQGPNDHEYCGGMDQNSGDSLFNLFLSPLDGETPDDNPKNSSSGSSSASSSTATTSPRSGLHVTPFLGNGTTASATTDASDTSSISSSDSKIDSPSAPTPPLSWPAPFHTANSSSSSSSRTHHRNSTSSTDCPSCFVPFRTHLPSPPPRIVTSTSVVVVIRTECHAPAPSGGVFHDGDGKVGGGHGHGSGGNSSETDSDQGGHSGGPPPAGPPQGLLPVAAGATTLRKEAWLRAGFATGVALTLATVLL